MCATCRTYTSDKSGSGFLFLFSPFPQPSSCVLVCPGIGREFGRYTKEELDYPVRGLSYRSMETPNYISKWYITA